MSNRHEEWPCGCEYLNDEHIKVCVDHRDWNQKPSDKMGTDNPTIDERFAAVEREYKAHAEEANRRRIGVTDSALAALTEAGDRITKLEADLAAARASEKAMGERVAKLEIEVSEWKLILEGTDKQLAWAIPEIERLRRALSNARGYVACGFDNSIQHEHALREIDAAIAPPVEAQPSTKRHVSDEPCHECGHFAIVGDRCFMCEANEAADAQSRQNVTTCEQVQAVCNAEARPQATATHDDVPTLEEVRKILSKIPADKFAGVSSSSREADAIERVIKEARNVFAMPGTLRDALAALDAAREGK